MPLRSFRPKSGRCKLCGGQVELNLPVGAPDPAECPKCGQNIEPCPGLSAPPPKVARPTNPSDAKAAGFQVYKRLGKGEYEKQ